MDKALTSKAFEQFDQYLKNKGLAFTSQRRQLLDFLSKGFEHFDAEELVHALRRKKVNISRATVYRTLSHLEEAKAIRKIALDESHTHFEFINDPHEHHEHILCEKCGIVIEFNDPVLEERIEAVAKKHKLTIAHHMIQIHGVCSACGKKDGQ